MVYTILKKNNKNIGQCNILSHYIGIRGLSRLSKSRSYWSQRFSSALSGRLRISLVFSVPCPIPDLSEQFWLGRKSPLPQFNTSTAILPKHPKSGDYNTAAFATSWQRCLFAKYVLNGYHSNILDEDLQ